MLQPLHSLLALEWTWRHALAAMALSAVLGAASLAVALMALVGLPATYFMPSHDRGLLRDHPRLVRWLAIAAKNGIGAVFIAVGIVMAIPGVPGHGLLTIFVGLLWVDFPHKRALERRLLQQPAVLRAVNEVRGRFSKPPLIL